MTSGFLNLIIIIIIIITIIIIMIVVELGHLLTRSGLTYPEAFLIIS